MFTRLKGWCCHTLAHSLAIELRFIWSYLRNWKNYRCNSLHSQYEKLAQKWQKILTTTMSKNGPSLCNELFSIVSRKITRSPLDKYLSAVKLFLELRRHEFHVSGWWIIVRHTRVGSTILHATSIWQESKSTFITNSAVILLLLFLRSRQIKHYFRKVLPLRISCMSVMEPNVKRRLEKRNIFTVKSKYIRGEIWRILNFPQETWKGSFILEQQS